MYVHLGRSHVDSIIDSLTTRTDERVMLRSCIARYGLRFIAPFIGARKLLTDCTDLHTVNAEMQKNIADTHNSAVRVSQADQLPLAPEYELAPLAGRSAANLDVHSDFAHAADATAILVCLETSADALFQS